MKQIAAAFVKAQKGFAPALKTNTNPHFRSKYVALDGCIEAVIDSLNNNGIALLQPTHDCEDGVTVETLFVHESGETMSGGKLHVPASKQDAQGYGSALTYARRYSLMAACGIAPEDDDGNAATKAAPQRNANGTLKGPGVIKATDGALEAIKDKRRLKELEDLSAEIVELFDTGKQLHARDAYCSLNDNDEKVALWAFLQHRSDIRTFIKNNPPTQHKEAA